MAKTEDQMLEDVKGMLGEEDVSKQEEKIIDPEKEPSVPGVEASSEEIKEVEPQEPVDDNLVESTKPEQEVPEDDRVIKAEKRVKDTQSLMQSVQTEKKELQEELDTAMTRLEEYQTLVKDRLSGKKIEEVEPVETQQTDAFSAVKEAYPEIVTDLADALTTVQNQIQDLTQKQKNSFKQTEDAFHFDKISRKYPNYEVIHKGDDFKTWHGQLSGFEQSAVTNTIKSGSHGDVISLYDKFYSDTNSNGKKTQVTQNPQTLERAKVEEKPNVQQVSNINLLEKDNTLSMKEIRGMEHTEENVNAILKAMVTNNIK